jgi:lipopolysaccharide/colanic/teichoic acid biosynthesis glycosyltransferase
MSVPSGSPPPVARAALKRTLDVVVAAVALVVLLPVLALVAAAVALDGPGPVFYRAERVGFRGRPLRMLKFRKMRTGAGGSLLTVADDRRLTRLGALLARTKLDELPQLWHVLRGDMSLVGPRPESPEFVRRFPADYALVLGVRPGLTGYTQLAFAREGLILDAGDPEGDYLSRLLPQKIALDRMYAARPSLRRDVRILGATVVCLVLRQPIAVHRATGMLSLRRRPVVTSWAREALGGAIAPAIVAPGEWASVEPVPGELATAGPAARASATLAARPPEGLSS